MLTMVARICFLLCIVLLGLIQEQPFGMVVESFSLSSSSRSHCHRNKEHFLSLSMATDLYETNNDPGSGRRTFLGSSLLSSGLLLSPPAVAASETTAETTATTPRVALWGFGNQNKLMAKYLNERGIPIVAVVSRHDIGKDYGSVDWGAWGEGRKKKTGVNIVSEQGAAATFRQTKPNVCILATRSTLEDIAPSLRICATSQVNVITIAEEVLESWTSSPKLTREIDQLFCDNGVSLTGSGFIDGVCCQMTMALSGMMHRIDGLEGDLSYNVDDYGSVLAQAHGVGLSTRDFQQQIVEAPQAKSYVYNTNEWLVHALGLSLKQTTEARKPVVSSQTIFSKSINKSIPPGDCIGMQVVATTTTQQGVTIASRQTGKCYETEDETDFCAWAFQGEPGGVKFNIQNPSTVQMTNTATLARIPQILAAEPGYIPTYHFPITSYKKL